MVKRIGVFILGVGVLLGVIFFLSGIVPKEDIEDCLPVGSERVYVEAFMTEQEEKEYSIEIQNVEYLVNKNVRTYLFMGTDESGNEAETGDSYVGSMADVLMLIVIDDHAKTYGVLQLNRDTITEIKLMQPDGSTYASADMQLCTAHWYGGSKEMSCENTVDAVSNLLGGFRIDGYYAVSMEAMQILNHSVDGVRVVIEDDLTRFDPAMRVGAELKLTDEQAAILLRSRYGLENDQNAARMHRQEIFLNSFLKEFQSQCEKDGNKVIDLYDRLRIYSTDNMDMNEIVGIFSGIGKYKDLGIKTISGQTVKGQALNDGIDHWEFYISTNSLVDEMQNLNMIGKG